MEKNNELTQRNETFINKIIRKICGLLSNKKDIKNKTESIITDNQKNNNSFRKDLVYDDTEIKRREQLKQNYENDSTLEMEISTADAKALTEYYKKNTQELLIELKKEEMLLKKVT